MARRIKVSVVWERGYVIIAMTQEKDVGASRPITFELQRRIPEAEWSQMPFSEIIALCHYLKHELRHLSGEE